MTRPWNVVMAWVMEHCDDKGSSIGLKIFVDYCDESWH